MVWVTGSHHEPRQPEKVVTISKQLQVNKNYPKRVKKKPKTVEQSIKILSNLIGKKIKAEGGVMPLAIFSHWLVEQGYPYRSIIDRQHKLGFSVGCDFRVRLCR